MFCENCGFKLNDDAKFCSNCGASIKKVDNSINVVATLSPDFNENIRHVTPIQSKSEPVVEPVVEPVIESVEEPVSEPFFDPVAQIEEPVVVTAEQNSMEPVAVATANTYVQPQQVEEPVNEVPVNKGRKIVSRIFSVIICIMLFATSLATAGVMTVRSVLDKNTVAEIVDDVDIETYIEDGAFDQIINEDAKEEDIKEIYEKGTFKDYLKDVLGDYGNYMLTGKKPEGIKYEDVKDVVKDNEKLIYDVTKHKVTSSDYKKIKDYVENDAEKHMGMLMEDKIDNSPVKTARIMISIYVVIGLILVSLLLALLLFVIRKVKTNGFLWFGVTLGISAIVFALTGLIAPMFLDYGNNAIMVAVRNIFENNIVVKFYINGAIMLATSALLILVYVIIRIIKNFKAKRA